jgi:transcriptional antiterminator Rof (Rho-off)
MSDYQSISCEAHSIYELAIMRGQSISVEIDGKVVGIKPTDIVTKRGAEFVTFIDEKGDFQEIRADLVSIQK